MIKSLLRKNRLASATLALGILAVGGLATVSTHSADGHPTALCMRSCP